MRRLIMDRRPENQLEFCDKLADLIDDQAEWSQATFGTDSERGPTGALKHLAKEAVECIDAIGTPDYRTELADCLLLLLDAGRRGGVSFEQIVYAARTKMIENKGRTWPKPTSDEPVEHVR
jgi:NTP pyrophosphatase (non-canonical NTP hydrolase)